MPKRRIAVIPGDGIGPEIMEATLSVLEATGLSAEWIYADAGLAALERCSEAVPKETIETIREVGVAIKGPTTTPSSGGHSSANVQLRKALDLYANVRPAHSLPGIKTAFDDKRIDIITIRENTEDLYAGIEYMPHPDMAQAIKVITRPGCKRLCEYGFQLARRTGRKRLTAVHKANIMKLTDGMFLEEFHKVAANYPDLIADEIIVDNCCMQLVTKPEQFDMLVTENLYGDIVSDLCAGLVGGLGLAAGANIGESCAVFEAVHGSAPDIAGKGIANPTALILSGVMMLHHLEEHEKANRLMDTVVRVCAEGTVLTGDLGGKASTKEYAANLCNLLQEPAFLDPARK
jgi:isocitrate dehydrogenase (NAD+)